MSDLSDLFGLDDYKHDAQILALTAVLIEKGIVTEAEMRKAMEVAVKQVYPAWLRAEAPVEPHGQEDQEDQAPEPDPDKDPTQ